MHKPSNEGYNLLMDSNLRPLIFISILVSLLVIQKFFYIKKDNVETLKRFTQNFLHVLLGQVFMLGVFYFAGKNFFDLSDSLKVGLFYMLSFPLWLKVALTFVIFDLALYTQHRASHRWAWFWKLHKLHHSDKVQTTSSAVRFHFLEIFVSALWKGLLIVLLGASFEHFMWFEVLLSSCALFNHSNIKLPRGLNSFLEVFLVTPELHRIHHSTDLKLTHSNFGFSVIIWDKIFGSFNENQDVPEIGIAGLTQSTFINQILLRNEEEL